jgi:hypothetical protein
MQPTLTGGINANDSSIGPSIGMSSYDDATIGDNTMSQDTNELIRMLGDNDANEIGDGGTSDAEGEGYKCVVSFKDGMKEVELEHLCCDANEIESGVEVDDNDAFVCEVTDENVGTLKDGYIRRVPLPRVPRIQSTSPVACATIHRNPTHTGYLPIVRIPTWSDMIGLLSGIGRCIERYIPPYPPVRLM